jgi:hypothetical protein
VADSVNFTHTWCIVSDTYRQFGQVVIGKCGANMTFKELQKSELRILNPKLTKRARVWEACRQLIVRSGTPASHLNSPREFTEQ